MGWFHRIVRPVRNALAMDRKTQARAFRIGLALSLAVTALGGVAVPAAAAPEDERTWVGEVEKHGRHYDYIGSSCPLEDPEPCPDYSVRYQIVPTTPQAARALPKVAGSRARLTGYRGIRRPGHNGSLMVSEVRSKRAPSDPIGRVP